MNYLVNTKNTILKLALIFSVLFLISFFISTKTSALSCEWIGTSSNQWSDSSNWNNCDGGIPSDGDELYFLNGSSNTNTFNNIGDLDIFYISVDDTYTITGPGNTISSYGNIFVSTLGALTLNHDIIIAQDQTAEIFGVFDINSQTNIAGISWTLDGTEYEF
jgi:hypothetical protein